MPAERALEDRAWATHPWVLEGTRGVRFGVMPLGLPDWSAARDFARRVEAMGFDAIWLPDHPLVGYDAWTMLAGFAEATSTLRLGTLVSCVAYRHPVVLARSAADVDRISGGRAILGLGTGDMPWEFGQMGLAYPPPRERAVVLEETLRIIRPLLAGRTVDYEGTYLRVKNAELRPLPVQTSGLPIVVAGGGQKTTLRLVAKYADACNVGAASWAGGAFTADAVTQKFEVLRRHCADACRPYESVLRTGLFGFALAETTAAAREKLDALGSGARNFMENVILAATPDEALSQIRRAIMLGFQYLIFTARVSDPESLDLLQARVLPVLKGKDPN
ncbi:MAG TPA: LLM class flavin-dependent oxidoreductase [Candidatus Limnocylindria bacterium]|nr:LLM class flavin-dependent oxidoreductase [Candidatus Limnocylindria bacterium]